MSDRSLRRLLERHHAGVRRGTIAWHAWRAFAAAAIAIAIAVLAGAPLALDPGGATVRLVILAFALLVALAWAALSTARRSPRFDSTLEKIELRFPEVRSWLRNALELERRTPADTSPELADALQRETVRRMEAVPLRTLAVPAQPARPLGVTVFALALVVIAMLVSPHAVRRSWATLWNPSVAAPPVRLAVEPGSVTITPGASLAVRARVWGSPRTPRLLREGGPQVAAVDEGLEPGGGHRWRFDLSQLTRAEDYRVRVASTESPRYRIALDGRPAPLSFEVEIRSPAYARLPVQHGSSTRGDLSALQGSRARLEITFDRDLESLDAVLPDGRAGTFRALTPRRWTGEVPVTRDGSWTLNARAEGGAGQWRYPVHAVADAPPLIAVRIPEGDLDLPAGQQVPVHVVGQDDLGLTELQLESRKDPAAPWRPVPLAAFSGHPREAEVASRWDASSLGLLPGETASFRFVLYDDNAVTGRGRAVSPEFELRFPSLTQLYDRTDEAQRGVQSTLEQAADRVQELQKSLERLERQQVARSNPNPQSAPAFERSEEMKNALDRQQELSKQLDQAAQQLRESVEQAAERRAFDEDLMRKMREMSELLQQIQSPELRRAMEKMQQALQNLDRRTLEQTLPQWREQNQQMLENLQRSIDLLKRLREEEQLASLAQRAEELKRQQDALNDAHEQAGERKSSEDEQRERESRAAQQQKASEESRKLAEDAKQMASSLEQQDEKQSMEQASEELGEQAAQSQQQAAQSARERQPQQAAQSGKNASQSLQRAADQMQKMAQQRQKEREGADLAAVRRAAQDLVALERANSQNLQSSDPATTRADRQTDLAEGVARVADSLSTLASRTPFLSPEVSANLGKALDGMQRSGRDLAAGNRARGEQNGRTAGQALNEAVLELRNTEGSMCNRPGGNSQGQTPSPSQQMGELSQQQSQLNQQTRSIARRLSEQIEQASGSPEELRRLSEEQARIRQRVEQLAREDESSHKLLGRLDQAGREMKEVEEALRSGNTGGDLEEKQQRILSRMLDAQRSVHRNDFDPERESRPGQDVVRSSPAGLPADLLRESDRLRLGLLKAEADRFPAQYRAFIETYLRTLNEKRR